MEGRYNLKSPGVKRLMKEAKELHEATSQYYAQPLEDNLFEWHFTVQGPADSDFDKGRYHGRIILPPEYPMKPPSIILLTPNGRFETGKKICLSMSAHHPETWQPSWSIRTVLLAIISFMPSKGGGAIGALDYTSEERRILAKKSLNWTCDICGSSNRTSLKPVPPEDIGSKQEGKNDLHLATQISFKKEAEVKSVQPMTSINDNVQHPELPSLNNSTSPLNGHHAAGAFTIQRNNTHAKILSTSDNNIKKRSQKSSREKEINRYSAGQKVPDGQNSQGYLSLLLIVILAFCLLLLLFRRITTPAN